MAIAGPVSPATGPAPPAQVSHHHYHISHIVTLEPDYLKLTHPSTDLLFHPALPSSPLPSSRLPSLTQAQGWRRVPGVQRATCWKTGAACKPAAAATIWQSSRRTTDSCRGPAGSESHLHPSPFSPSSPHSTSAIFLTPPPIQTMLLFLSLTFSLTSSLSSPSLLPLLFFLFLFLVPLNYIFWKI